MTHGRYRLGFRLAERSTRHQYWPYRRDETRRLFHRSARWSWQQQDKNGVPPSSSSSSSFSLLLAWYSRQLDTRPILTKSITSAIIGASGDVASQCIEKDVDATEETPNDNDDHQNKNNNNGSTSKDDTADGFWLDTTRTARFGFLGLVLIGPVIHGWFEMLVRWFPGNTASTVVKRVALDQFIFSPVFVATFLASLWTLESQSDIAQKLQEQLPSTVVANWSLWMPAQVINFRFVSPKYQVLFSNFVGFVWNVYLSYKAHSAISEPREEADDQVKR